MIVPQPTAPEPCPSDRLKERLSNLIGEDVEDGPVLVCDLFEIAQQRGISAADLLSF